MNLRLATNNILSKFYYEKGDHMNRTVRRQGLMFIIIVAAIAFVSSVYSTAFAYCSPQCVPYARQLSGINHCKVGENGTAKDWYNCEAARGDTKSASSTPKKKTVVILNIGTTGHAVYINSVDDGEDGKYPLKISQSNARNRASGTCDIETKIKATYNKKKKTFKYKGGYLVGKTFDVIGFITK